MPRADKAEKAHAVRARAGGGPVTMRPRRSQAERRAETERRLLEAATRLIAERGSDAVSLADVGREAGYSRGIVGHQFGSKLALLQAVVTTTQAAFAPERSAGTGLESLLLTAQAYVDHLYTDAPSGQAALRLWAEATGEQHPLRPFFAERDAWFRATLTGQVDTGRRDGTVRADADPHTVAVALVAMLRGIGLQLAADPTVAARDDLVTQTSSLIRHGLGS